MNRIVLFIGTNIAILVVLSLVMQLLDIESLLNEQGTQLDLRPLLIFSAVIGFVGSFISLAISKWSAKCLTGARVIKTPQNATESWLLNTVQRQAQVAEIGMPEVAIYDAPDVNAFATGANRNSALVAVSTGLMNQLDQKEIEAVLEHEVSHVANGDMVTLALIQGVVNTFVVFLSRVIGFFVDRLIFRTERGYGPGFFIANIITQILLGILASMIVMWFSRRREFRADSGGAKLAGRENMIDALERLHGLHQPSALPKPMQAFGISSGRSAGFKKLLMSHSPIEERIAALKSA